MDNKPCVLLEERQITLGISEYLSSRIRDQKHSSEIIITLQDIESALINKFKCILPFDKKNLTLLTENMIESRNLYLNKLSNKSKFVLKNPIIQSVVKPNIYSEKSPANPFITTKQVPTKSLGLNHLQGLFSCFAGRVKINNVDIKTQTWPFGILFIPNFIDNNRVHNIATIIKNQSTQSSIIECLKSILKQSEISSSNIVDYSILNADNSTLHLKSIKNTNITFIWLGLSSSINISFKNNSNIEIPLFPGSLLKIDKLLSEWTGKIYTNNIPNQTALLFLSS